MTQGDPYSADSHGTEHHDAATPSSKRTSSVNLPTVLASAGVAAVVSAVIVTIGVVGLVISGDIDGEPSASAQTPTVVNLGAAQSALTQQPVAQAAPTSAAAPAAPAPAAAAAGEQVPESGGGAGAGTAPVATAAPPTAQSNAPQQAAPATPVAAPQALTAGQLNTKVRILMNTGASRAARADELHSGARGLGSVDGVANLLRVSGAGFTYRIIDPVTVNGTTLNATLQMTLVGQGSKTQALSWVWTDGKWKLSNSSTCAVAGLALLPCTV
ncbi:hypothetical protein ASG12_04960 [Williamsia sp. Leaf354]|uniref:hypothetical protein n=1 Tax=Williamsia sp. Leaf354 TaxID=1736349 RepID=UPI0006FEAE0A|nr:hypothetical protein [Williamsia sp. Leaf354]KQS00282.1 hypothetical protein ASG12_04960 [Williamsia sp. Leaf354]